MAKEFAKRFYSSKQWKAVRAEVLRRDLFTCQECLAARASEVHHKIALCESNINDENVSLNIENLVSLCHSCHDNITKGFSGDIENGFEFDDSGQVIKI